jgi:hypothetical protein
MFRFILVFMVCFIFNIDNMLSAEIGNDFPRELELNNGRLISFKFLSKLDENTLYVVLENGKQGKVRRCQLS